jgi:hypothetical protein
MVADQSAFGMACHRGCWPSYRRFTRLHSTLATHRRAARLTSKVPTSAADARARRDLTAPSCGPRSPAIFGGVPPSGSNIALFPFSSSSHEGPWDRLNRAGPLRKATPNTVPGVVQAGLAYLTISQTQGNEPCRSIIEHSDRAPPPSRVLVRDLSDNGEFGLLPRPLGDTSLHARAGVPGRWAPTELRVERGGRKPERRRSCPTRLGPAPECCSVLAAALPAGTCRSLRVPRRPRGSLPPAAAAFMQRALVFGDAGVSSRMWCSIGSSNDGANVFWRRLSQRSG